MEVADVRELWQLRQRNARLKKMLAEWYLEVEVMKECQAKLQSANRTSEIDSGCLCPWGGPRLAEALFAATLKAWLLEAKNVSPCQTGQSFSRRGQALPALGARSKTQTMSGV